MLDGDAQRRFAQRDILAAAAVEDFLEQDSAFGLMLIGVEIDPKYEGHDFSMNMLKNGVYAKETHETNLRIAPPIVIDEEGMDKIASALDKSLAEMSPR